MGFTVVGGKRTNTEQRDELLRMAYLPHVSSFQARAIKDLLAERESLQAEVERLRSHHRVRHNNCGDLRTGGGPS